MVLSARFLSIACLALMAGHFVRGAEPSRHAPVFEADVAPILAEHCQKCHSGDKAKGGLNVTSAAALSRGGESGPALVARQPEKSLLVEVLDSGQMPPEDEPKLTAEQIELVRRWIAGGANSTQPDQPDKTPHAAPTKIDAAAREFWSFRRLARPEVPPCGTPGCAPVDAFLLARLNEHAGALAPEADRLTLLRRATYDLVGLPPTPEEIDAFLADDRPDAYERVVDRLLASPHFGERWGRHWLDAAGYSDITGGDNDAGIIKLSEGKWKYRDYVVRSLNEDKPYERFLIEQLAGDELVDWRTAASFTPETEELLVATGFLRSAADDTDEKELTTPDILNGVLQRTSEVVANNLLGLTLGCAKCHDHKYEPIAQQDYYRLLAVFSPAFNPASWVPPKQRALADISPAQKAEAERHNAELDRQIAELKSQQAEIRRPHHERLQQYKLATLPESIRDDTKTAVETPANKRSEVQKYLAAKFEATIKVADAEVVAASNEDEKTRLVEADRRISHLNATRRTWGLIQAAYDVGPPPETRLLRRGNHLTPGPKVEPGFLAVLCSADGDVTSDAVSLGRARGQSSGRRLALALWLTDWNSPAGALAARVMVNRVWQHLYGRGIVETSENLGISGARPANRELLEWLSCRFVSEGRRLKRLVRLLVTSRAYRQSSAPTSTGSEPADALVGRMPLKRLEAEIVRDAMLAASGKLDRSLGGPPLPLETRNDGSVVIQEKGLPPSAKSRRSLYVLARRNYHLSMLGVFDQPAMSTNCPKRQQSAVVLQSLAMLNDAFVLEQADAFARRVVEMVNDGATTKQVELAFRIALGRGPTASEESSSVDFVGQHLAEYSAASVPQAEAKQKSLAHLCHMLLSSNEFLYAP